MRVGEVGSRGDGTGRACAGGELSVRIERLGEGSGHPGPDPQSRRHWDAGHKLWTWHHVPGSPAQGMAPCPSRPPQAVEAAQLAEDLKVQLEHVQTRLREIQPCLAESRAAREKESFNLKRAQVCAWGWGRGRAGRPGPCCGLGGLRAADPRP